MRRSMRVDQGYGVCEDVEHAWTRHVVILAHKLPVGEHDGRYSTSFTNEVAVGIEGRQFDERDIELPSRDNNVQTMELTPVHVRPVDKLHHYTPGHDGLPAKPGGSLVSNKRVIIQFSNFQLLENNNLIRYLYRVVTLASRSRAREADRTLRYCGAATPAGSARAQARACVCGLPADDDPHQMHVTNKDLTDNG
ncbi:hypothetical protein EVAR_33221_1 [Eumeta japonica]|uniref:Uncharacterized protein n=1 Tax=Eumeta variegata TaxID=151549 RepID=A0A4C1W0P9_EUMVA|nr:hypothetical protein EVAR_33221_1 [Eumeta japonica]